MTEETIRLNREDLKDLKEKGYITRDHFADNSKTKRWKPEHGDQYWYADSDATCVLSRCIDDEFDLGRYKLGFVFKTKEEAQKELDRRLAEQELLDMCDWDGGEKVYLIEYNDQRDIFDWNWFDYIYSPYRFATKESCQKAIDTLGAEKLKLIFRID